METDPFFTLLTDALRAGPGSPQWHDAVAALRQQGLEASDEHRMLIEARENLESGRDYRAVRAGPGFTRKLMGEIENETVGKPHTGVPTATIIAIVCGLLVLSVVAYVVYRSSTTHVTGKEAVEELEKKKLRFFDTIATARSDDPAKDWKDWNPIGSLKLDLTNGLRPAPDAQSKNLGGGEAWKNSIPGNQAFSVDVTVKAPAPSSAVLLEAFVSTDPKFSPDKGTSSRDLVWQLRGYDQQVLLSGSGQIQGTAPTFHDGDTVRLIVDQDVAIVEVVAAGGGKTQRLWAGAHDLGTGPRYIGVRFLQTGAAGKQDVSVQQIKILTSSPG